MPRGISCNDMDELVVPQGPLNPSRYIYIYIYIYIYTYIDIYIYIHIEIDI